MPQPVTLLDYANDRENVVIRFHAAVDRDVWEYPAGSPEWETDGMLDRLYGLSGAVDEGGRWAWDGIGDPADLRGNTIEAVSAEIDAATWASLADEGADQ